MPLLDDGYRPCETCGGKHRFMEICPAKPGYIELLKAWINGDRGNPMAWIAAIGSCVFLFLVVLAITTTIAG